MIWLLKNLLALFIFSSNKNDRTKDHTFVLEFNPLAIIDASKTGWGPQQGKPWTSSGNTASQTENKILFWLKTHEEFLTEVPYAFVVNEPQNKHNEAGESPKTQN